ncbi:hypothetical protein BKA61DRAFT_689452 [Leptodontidium sp. MPI-SDFR-AT-0119]|nr:hypothetical protein BKA61DRAFT_689452 [Leptodontidium sp. MPI-SDFR-AT-0119]
MAHNKRTLKTIPEYEDEKFVSKGWEDFDHSQKFSLGVRGSTWTVRDKETSEKFVLQSCQYSAWTRERYKLLRMGRKWTGYLVPPRYMFFRKEWVYVCSEIGGTCLADIIDSTTSLTEAQTAMMVVQVIKILQALANAGIWYDVKASNVFISAADGHVRLASFGRRIEPEKQEWHHRLLNCQSVGHLVYHMLTRLPKIDQADFEPWEQMMTVRTKLVDIPVSIEHQLSAGFFDFIEACMGGGDDLDVLLNVSSPSLVKTIREEDPNQLQHRFLHTGTSGTELLLPLVHHTADTSLTGHRLRTFSRSEARQKQVIHATKHVMEFDSDKPDEEEEGEMDWQREGAAEEREREREGEGEGGEVDVGGM